MKASEKKTQKSKLDNFTEDCSIMKQSPPTSTKELFIGPSTGLGEKVLKQYLPIVEMVVKKEYKSIPSYLTEYSELVNIGLITVNKLLEDAVKNKKTYNSSYIAQAVKWAIKDELRTKYGWYGVKQSQQKDEEETYDSPKEITVEGEECLTSKESVEKVFESILYLDDLAFETVSDNEASTDELEKLELKELQAALKKAVSKLPEKHKRVIELRFYEGKRGNDVAIELGVTPSRISHMIQDAIEKVRQMLIAEGLC